MINISTKLKETRENHGVSIEEAADDLKVKVNQLQALESGDLKSFKDVFYLKVLIKDYAKYLGLDPEEVAAEFTEFLFDFTSKIPLDKIEQANKLKEKQKENRIASPYTISKKKVNKLSKKVITIIAIVTFLIIGALTFFYFYDDIFPVNNSQKIVLN